jgi:hypothetical protein
MRCRVAIVVWPLLAGFLVGCGETESQPKTATAPIANVAETVKGSAKKTRKPKDPIQATARRMELRTSPLAD